MLHRFFGFLAVSTLSVSCISYPKRAMDRNISSVESPVCAPLCNKNDVCMNTFTPSGAQCAGVPSPAPLPDLILPFDKYTEVICTHSSGSGSHSGSNAFYAIDLASDYSQPAAVIRATADGVAYVFLGEDGTLCPEPQGLPSSAQPSTCGDSWGNRVKILHANGYFSFYVHLDHPLVKTGDVLHQGDPIGIEGRTGAAGHRHLHWSIQKLPGATQTEWKRQILTYTGASVPFSFKAVQDGKIQYFDIHKISCAHAGIGQAPIEQQPKFKGVN